MKLSLDSAKIKGFFILNCEKMILGAIGLAFVGLTYLGFTVSTYKDKTPDQLAQEARQASDSIRSSVFDYGSSGLEPSNITQILAKTIDLISPEPYRHEIPFRPPISTIVQKRPHPLPLAVADLQVKHFYGSVAFRGSGQAQNQRNDEGDKKRPSGRRDRDNGRNRGGGAGMPGGGGGMGMPGGGGGMGMPGGAGGMGRPGGGRGDDEDDGMTPGGMGGMGGMGGAGLGGSFGSSQQGGAFLPPAGAELKGFSAVIVTGLIPVNEQFEKYTELYEYATYKSPMSDQPVYTWYLIERAEVTSNSYDPNTLAWQRVDTSAALAKTSKWAGFSPEVASPMSTMTSPMLTFPLPPLVDRHWDKSVVHDPEIPLWSQMQATSGSEQGEEASDNQDAYADKDGNGIPDVLEGKGPQGGAGMGGGMFPGGAGGGGMMPGSSGGAGMGMGGGMMPGGAGGGGMMPGSSGGAGMGLGGGMGGGMMPGSSGGAGMGLGGGMGGGMMPGSSGGAGMGLGGGMGGMGRMGGDDADGMGGMMPGSYGGNAPAQATPHRLFRYFDENVEIGKRYVYRVKLILRNPNFGIEDRFLEQPELAKAETIESDWSDISPIVEVGRADFVYAGGTKAGKGPTETKATVLTLQWDKTNGLTAAKEYEIVLGQVANFSEKEVKVFDPVTRAAKTLNDFRFVTEQMLADVRGGELMDKETASPGEYLFLDPLGRLIVHTELDDIEQFLLYQSQIEGLEGGEAGFGDGMMPPGSGDGDDAGMDGFFGAGDGRGRAGGRGGNRGGPDS